MWNPFRRPIMEFYTHPDNEGVLPEPKPAAKFMPEWFKKVPIRIEPRDAFGAPTLTIKQCMPVLDAMSLGYVIPLCGDLHVKTNHDCTEIAVTNPSMQLAEFHDIRQIGDRTAPGWPAQPIKFVNPWVIKTAPGWSTLILPLINRAGEDHFTCLSGMVDTDRYPKEINFPAIWHTPNFDDIIPAGTPLVVAIPIKRSAIPKQPVIRKMKKKEFLLIDTIRKKLDSRRHVYKNELREPRK